MKNHPSFLKRREHARNVLEHVGSHAEFYAQRMHHQPPLGGQGPPFRAVVVSLEAYWARRKIAEAFRADQRAEDGINPHQSGMAPTSAFERYMDS